MKIVEKAVKFAGYKVEERGFLVEHFDVDKANNLLSYEDKQVLIKEIKTEHQLLAEQDKELGLIKINGQEVSRVKLYNFGTKINQDYLDKKEVNMTAREYLDSLKNSKNVEEVIQATKVIPFIGSEREIEEAEQIRKPLLELARGTINFILTAVSLSRSEPKKNIIKPFWSHLQPFTRCNQKCIHCYCKGGTKSLFIIFSEAKQRKQERPFAG